MSTQSIQSIGFVSLGCPKNLVDSEQMLATLVDAGYELVADHDDADAIIINTCGFLEASKEESVDVINDAVSMKETGKVKRVIAAGCLVQRHRAKMLEWCPGIDAMIGVFDRDHIVDAMQETPEHEARPNWIAANALLAARARGIEKPSGYFEDDSNRIQLTPRHWAYLRVSEGCNQNCSFCTIPSIRGKMRSKPVETIVEEAKQLLASGVFELNLIGQDTTSYGYDIDYSEGLVGLLTALNDTVANSGSGGGWIRLMYAYPTYFTDEMIDAMARLPHVVPYIDIPLQHATDNMLDAMRRNVEANQQSELLEKLRKRIPDVAIRTTFITGFPGETEADHNALRKYIEQHKFEAMGVFQYSKEQGTVAGTMEDDKTLRVPEALKQQREEELMLTQQTIAFNRAAQAAEHSESHQILIDAYLGDTAEGALHLYKGRTKQQAPDIDACTIVMSEADLPIGAVVSCKITDSDGYDMIARPNDELEQVISLPLR